MRHLIFCITATIALACSATHGLAQQPEDPGDQPGLVADDGFELDRDFEDEYLDAVKEIGARYFHGVTRFATSAFMRAKLGDSLGKRGVAPHIYESEDEAKQVVRETLPRT